MSHIFVQNISESDCDIQKDITWLSLYSECLRNNLGSEDSNFYLECVYFQYCRTKINHKCRANITISTYTSNMTGIVVPVSYILLFGHCLHLQLVELKAWVECGMYSPAVVTKILESKHYYRTI